MNKATVAALAISAALVSSGLVYPQTMVVDGIDGDTVNLVTATGMVYQMTGSEDYEEGDLVSTVMWTNGTADVTDDAILAARFSGWNMN